MIENTIDWATSNGPPNWVFIVAVLTTPAAWAKRAKKAIDTYLDKRLG